MSSNFFNKYQICLSKMKNYKLDQLIKYNTIIYD